MESYPDIEKAYKLKKAKEKEEAKQIVKEELEAKPKEEVKEKEKKKEKKPMPIDELMNKKAVYVLRDGEKIEGTLKQITKFEILLETENSKILIFKHAIDYIIY